MAQMWRTLLMVLRFGLFPYCLNALVLFFCRTEELARGGSVIK